MSTMMTTKLLTRPELAAALGIHVRTSLAWQAQGMPVARRTDRGPLFRLDAVQAWRRSREATRSDFTEASARKERAQAVLTEQLTAVRAGELLTVAQVERELVARVGAARAKILSWPQVLPDRIVRAATVDGLRGARKILEEAARDAVLELGDAELGR